MLLTPRGAIVILMCCWGGLERHFAAAAAVAISDDVGPGDCVVTEVAGAVLSCLQPRSCASGPTAPRASTGNSGDAKLLAARLESRAGDNCC